PPEELEGLVVLDGTWSQAKTLWWRNPWLLKLKRAVLVPQTRSLYRELRKEPRRECLSTLEAIGMSLVALGEPQETEQELNQLFSHLLANYKNR
ncbi:MAG: DTW domain-containing protein, partial [Bdellovibrionia bacterium]